MSGVIGAATLVVGPQTPYPSIGHAARAAKDGDTVEVLSGVYRGDTAVWTQHRLTIRGMGQRPVLLADGRSAQGKAIWVVRGGDITVENLEFRGARVADGNGAGIRLESGRLTVRRCAFADNETGILTVNRDSVELAIEDSEFAEAPTTPGPLHHLLYVGAIGRFSLTGSHFHQGYRGHLVKTRARENIVRYNRIQDGPRGQASYELEFPNGGLAVVVGNIIGQSSATLNPVVVAYGAEGPRWQDNALVLSHNTLISHARPGAWFLRVWKDRMHDDVEVLAVNNLVLGTGIFSWGAQGQFVGNVSETSWPRQGRDTAALAPAAGSPLWAAAADPGSFRGQPLAPDAQFVAPAGTQPLPPLVRWTVGALQRLPE